jgi:branched-chain amino acid transport system ATP-binding protein
MKVLRAEHLSVNFGGVQALMDITFSVEAGEHLGIIGPNGAGKTTLFNVLNGQISPASGQIYFFGRKITNMSTNRRAHLGQARSFQQNSLFSKLTVLDNILLALQGTKPSRFQMFRPATAYKHLLVKAEELLRSMALWEKRDDLVQAISYGEQRKMEIILSLTSEPKLLLLDEPTTGLTADESADLINMIRNFKTDITLLVIAHDLDLVFTLCDRIMVLHYGQITAEGSPEEIRADSRVKEIYIGIEEGTGNVGAG